MDPDCEDDCYRLCGFVFFGEEKEMNYCWGIHKNVWDSGGYWTFGGQCRYSIFLVKLHGEHLPEFFISGQWLGGSIQQGSHLHNQLWLPVTWGTPPGIIEQTQSICSIYSFNRNIIALKNESMYNSFKPNQLQMITRYKCQSSVQINPGIMPKMYRISHSC